MQRTSWHVSVAAVAVLALYHWLGSDGDSLSQGYAMTGQKSDYYNLLVDGMLDGQLSMKVERGSDGSLPWLMDASRYDGNYYLYFGVVPAVTLFLPYTVITGHDLPGNAATLLFVAFGFLLNLRLYLEARNDHFKGVPKYWDVAMVMLMASGSGTPMLVMAAGVYEVAIAGGYACLSGMMLGLYKSMHRDDLPLSRRWLAFASLAGGLAVGCRPTCLFALPILLGPCFDQVRRGALKLDAKKRFRRTFWTLSAAAVPAAVVGAMLMAYNYGRFGDPFEFGFKYQVNEFMSSGLPLARLDFVWSNLKWYYLTPPEISPYFPFAMPINAGIRPADYYGFESIHGQWLAMALGSISVAFAIWARSASICRAPGLSRFVILLSIAFALVFLATASFGVRANRFVVDFQGCLVAALCLGGSRLAHALSVSQRSRIGLAHRSTFGFTAVLLSIFNTFAALQWMDGLKNSRPATFRRLAYWGNHPSHWLQRLGFFDYGGYRFSAVFAPQSQTVREPLLVTGTDGMTDVLYVHQHPGGIVEFRSYSFPIDGAKSRPISVETDKEYDIEVHFGSLYPPVNHPFYDGWTNAEIMRAKTTIRVLLDQEEVVYGNRRFHDAAPYRVAFGRNPYAPDRRFSGAVRSFEFVPLSRADLRLLNVETGLWRIETNLRTISPKRALPVLASGESGRGNLLGLERLTENTVQFGFDEWGYGQTLSPPIELSKPDPQVLDVWIGPRLADRVRQSAQSKGVVVDPEAADYDPMRIWINGQIAWEVPVRGNRDSYDFIAFGSNPQGFSSAVAFFEGPIFRLTLTDSEAKSLLLRGLGPSPRKSDN